MMNLLGPLVALILAVRAATSRDALGMRLAGAIFAVLPPVAGAAFSLAPVRSTLFMLGGSISHTYVPALAAAYLCAWALRTSDPQWVRVTSGLVAGAFLLPFLFAFVVGAAILSNR